MTQRTYAVNTRPEAPVGAFVVDRTGVLRALLTEEEMRDKLARVGLE